MMNWYEMKLINEAHLDTFYEDADMARLAEAARGNKGASLGLEDVLSARALVRRIAGNPAQSGALPRLALQPAQR
ncbi:MAG: hypothetical protein JNL42_19610 [Anaerolineae bacterium]|nr:hypothetical protein [Anaerolineae bacterium]